MNLKISKILCNTTKLFIVWLSNYCLSITIGVPKITRYLRKAPQARSQRTQRPQDSPLPTRASNAPSRLLRSFRRPWRLRPSRGRLRKLCRVLAFWFWCLYPLRWASRSFWFRSQWNCSGFFLGGIRRQVVWQIYKNTHLTPISM